MRGADHGRGGAAGPAALAGNILVSRWIAPGGVAAGGGRIVGWFAGRLPDEWFDGAAEVSVDRDEILVVGTLTAPETAGDDVADAEARAGRITRFREQTREQRMRIAREAEHRYGSWLGELREAMESVQKVRDAGPS